MREGDGMHVLVNANAKRGGRRVAAQIARALPGATVRLTRTVEEIEGWLRTLPFGPPQPSARCILSAGGDGTAVALLAALDRVVPRAEAFPPIGALPLGTGNAWAHALGARSLDTCVKALARSTGPIPTKRYTIFECEGALTFFAGAGWDAQILEDFRQQVASSPSRRLAKSVWGYLGAMAFRTVPTVVLHGRPHVIIENLADHAYTVAADGSIHLLPGAGRGAVLYEGMASVAGCATCPEFGYRFRAYPFAERLLGYMQVRVYDQTTLRAIRDIPKLWRGAHPLRGMHDWFSTHVRLTFSRPVALEIGGEAVGTRQSVECRASPRAIDALDWRRLV